MRLFFVIGTRPEVIKMAPVILEARTRGIEVFIAATGQHKEMLHQMLDFFGLIPDEDLQVMAPGQRLAYVVAESIQGLDRLIEEFKPSYVLVQGDTGTTLAGAMAGFYNQVPVVHIEAGLRSFNKMDPFPEEMNRSLVSKLATIHFAPTEQSRSNLLSEGVSPSSVYVTGNTSIDALILTKKRVEDRCTLVTTDERTVLVTVHRRENRGERLKSICEAISAICQMHRDVKVVFPMHSNPELRAVIKGELEGVPQVELRPALSYEDFVEQLMRSHVVLTDSGGIQEEAPALDIPVLVLRDETERPEAIASGAALLIGAKVDAIVEHTSKLLQDNAAHRAMAEASAPYGDGRAAIRIMDVLGG